MQGTLPAVGRTKSPFPNLLEKLVLMTGHLTSSLLEGEIAKMSRPQEMIFIMHLKPQSLQEIETEIQALGHNDIEFLKDGEMILA